MQQGRIFTEMMETIFAQSAEMLQLLCARFRCAFTAMS